MPAFQSTKASAVSSPFFISFLKGRLVYHLWSGITGNQWWGCGLRSVFWPCVLSRPGRSSCIFPASKHRRQLKSPPIFFACCGFGLDQAGVWWGRQNIVSRRLPQTVEAGGRKQELRGQWTRRFSQGQRSIYHVGLLGRVKWVNLLGGTQEVG